MKESEGNDETGRKRKRTTTGSQRDEDSSNNMAKTLAEINRKLDLALARVQEIEEIKQKQHQLEKENASLRESLDFAHQSIKDLTERAKAQKKALSELTKDVHKLTQTATFKRERAIKLESHSRKTTLSSTTFLKKRKNLPLRQKIWSTPVWKKNYIWEKKKPTTFLSRGRNTSGGRR